MVVFFSMCNLMLSKGLGAAKGKVFLVINF